MEKKQLDFSVIGAQKSGTTTLFKYLAEHPSIYVPPEKEVPFFSNNDYYKKGWEWYLNRVFGDAPKDMVWGKVTPQYMCYQQVPERLFSEMPNVKCIAILRNPVERAYSHYRMGVGRGYESHSFEECIQAQLSLKALTESRLNPTRTNSYIIWGEYGRIISGYTQHFPIEQILILYTESLEHNPKDLLMQIYNYLAVEPFQPKGIGQKFRQGGTKARMPTVNKIINIISNKTIRRIVPFELWSELGRLYLSFELWNTVPDKSKEIPLGHETLQKLYLHYKEDTASLERITQSTVVWS